jgi:hypothetical protein
VKGTRIKTLKKGMGSPTADPKENYKAKYTGNSRQWVIKCPGPLKGNRIKRF